LHGGMGRGWMGPERSFGGMSRTYGLQRMADRGLDGPPQRIDRARIRRAASYLWPYWARWLIILLCIALSSGLGVLPPLCVKGILDHAIPDGDVGLLELLVAVMVGLTISTGLIGVLQNYTSTRVGQSIMFDLRNQLYRHLQRMSLRFYTTARSGEIVSRINNDVGAVYGAITGTLIAIVQNVLTATATLIVIFSMSWRLAVLAVIVVPVFYLPTRVVGKIRRRLSQQTQERQADLLAHISERLNIGGMLLTKIFGQAEEDATTFSQRSGELVELNVKQAMAGRWLFMALSVVSVAGPAMVYLYGGWLCIQEELSIGAIIAFVAYLSNLYRPMAQLANVYVDVQGALAVFERIFEYLDLRPEVEDAPDAVDLPEVGGRITFEGVSFAYPKPTLSDSENGANGEEADGKPPVRLALSDVSFDIEPGERVALVGPSGAGKTTITYLVPRFFDPSAGRITVDGLDLCRVTQDSLRENIGMVTQETFLFHATVRENLRYARPDATEAEILAATRAANVHDFIAALDEGYETVVGERGFRLSGGEKQRLSIARALLKDPRILILDEATSNLDATSEHLVQEALETLLHDRTALIIAHRLSTVLNADRILVLDEGRLVEAGRHEQLLALNGLYATLYRRQFRKVIEHTAAH